MQEKNEIGNGIEKGFGDSFGNGFRKILKVMSAVLLALVLAVGLLPSSALANEGDITVFVSFEGYNLGHGFYIEPTAVSVPAGSSVTYATLALLNQRGYEYEFNTWGMLDRIHGIHPGYVSTPDFISIELGDGSTDGSVGALDYTEYSGWMFTLNHSLTPVGADDVILEEDDVIRWQFTVEGWGADLGLSPDRSGFSQLYEHADKSALIRGIFADGADADAVQAALDVIINPVSTQGEVDAALAALGLPEQIADETITAIEWVIEWVNPFTDVSADDWFYDHVRFVHSNGLMTGTEAGRFSPDADFSFAMAVTVFWRMEGEPAAVSPLYDLQEGQWYAPAAAWAIHYGGLMHPDERVRLGWTMTAGDLLRLIQDYAERSTGIDTIDELHILGGLASGDALFRAEAAAVLQRFIESAQ